MKKIISLLVVIIIFIFLGLLVFLPKRNFSENENRYLEKMVKFNFRNIKSGKFQKSVDNYFSDHFPLRDLLLGSKNKVFHILGVYRMNDVYYTYDNKLIEEFNKPKNNKKIVRIINKFSKKNSDKNISFLLAPTSLYVYEDNISKYNLNYSEDDVIDYYKKHLDTNFIDVRESMKSHKSEYIYYNSDHHWTTLGAYYAYKDFCQYNNMRCDNFNYKKVSDDFRGTLYSKVLDKSTKKDYIIKVDNRNEYNIIADDIVLNQFYDDNYLNKKDKYSYFLGGNRGLITIENNNTNSIDSILIIKDSYANCFIPFISNNYKNIYVVDPRYYENSIDELIDSYNIKNILFIYNVLTIDDDIGILSINM